MPSTAACGPAHSQAAGPPFFWGLLVVLVGQFLVSLILSEVASAWPLEGGVYQWTRKQTGPTAGWFAAMNGAPQ